MVDWQTALGEAHAGVCGWCGNGVRFERIGSPYLIGSKPIESGQTRGGRVDTTAALYRCPLDGCSKPTLLMAGISVDRAGVRTRRQVRQIPEATAQPIDGVPESVQRDRLEAWSSFYAGNVRAAAIMGRAAMQRAIRLLKKENQLATGRRESLASELDALKDAHVITEQLAQLGHEVRIAGNDAAHPETLKNVDRESVEESLRFVDDFITYTLAVPNRVRRRIERRHEESD